MKKKILIVGSLNMDIDISVDNFPKAGQTIIGKKMVNVTGGKGANQALACGKLGGDASMLGCVGCDDFGKIQLETLGKYVNVDNIAVRNNEHTGTAVIYINDSGENSIVVIPCANSTCDVDYLKENDKLFKEADYVIFQLEIPYEAVFYGIRRSKELGKTVILNPAPAPNKGEIPDDIFPLIDYITPNETETAKMTGISTDENVEKAGEKLIDLGVKNALITLGSKGCVLIKQDKTKLYSSAFKTKVVDTTAAGDCFNGAFVVGLSEGMSEEDALVFANKASAIAVSRPGAQNSIPSREEII